MEQAQILGIALGLGTLSVLLMLIFIKSNIIICQPNELVVLAGRKRRTADGKTTGYRIIRGGRGFKRPLLESVARLPLTSQPIQVQLGKAMCAGMIPVSIEGHANIKLAGREEEGLEAAVERFLDRGFDAVVLTSQQAIEGALRGILATVSPEEANAQRLQLAEQVTERVRADLSRLGIVLDIFQIDSVYDEQGYLEAIGRKKVAAVRRDARIAEAEAEAKARSVSAEQDRVGREAEIEAEISVVKAENALAVRRADLRAESNRAEQRAEVAGTITKAKEEVELQTARAELSAKREEADTVVPAQARRQALMLEAKGRAARILEDGQATARVIELMREQWQAGENRDLFLIQLMPELLDKVTKVIADNLTVDKLTIVDSGDGKGIPNYVNNLTGSAVALLEQLKTATGIDIEKMLRDRPRGIDLPTGSE